MTILTGVWRYRLVWPLLVLALAIACPPPAAAQSMLQQLVTPPDQQEQAADPAEAPTLSAGQTQLIVELLRDEQAREALIAELERLAAARAAEVPGAPETDVPLPPGAAESVPADAAAAEEDLSFGRRLAQETQEIAQGMAAQAVGFWASLRDVPGVFAGIGRLETDFLVEALIELALVIVTTVTLFVVLRYLARRLYRWMGRKAKPLGFLGTATLYVASVIVDALVVVLAWAAGYALAVTLFNEFGQIAIRQTLYLNAFLAVEMVKVGIRAVLSPAVTELRPVHVTDYGARRSYRTLNIVVSIIGYGQLLVVPIVAQNVGYYSSRSVSALLLLIALLILATAVLRHRHPVADWLSNGRDRGAPRNAIWRMLSRFWHVPVLLYLAAVFVIVITRPGDVLMPVLGASAKVAIAAIVGWMLAGMLGRAIAHGIRLPASLNRRLPLLQRRLNRFIPRILFVLRFIILFAVIGYTLNVIGMFDVDGWLDGPVGVWLTATAGGVALILLLSSIAWLAVASWVDYRLNPDFGTVPTSRETTLLALLRNAAAVGLIVLTLMFVLSEIGIDIAPLLASAGIVGLAIGFGAQKLVQDIITGIFIQLENAINVGDVVTVGGISGVVERLTIRSVSLRDLSGIYHIIPFSSVDLVSNFMREFAFVVADIGVAYRVDVEEAKQAMFDAFEELRADPDHGPTIIADLEWFGVDKFADSAVIIRARIKTLPGKQWGVGRAYNGIIKRVFDERGIEIPFPHLTLYVGEGTQGEAPVAVRRVSGEAGEPVREGDRGSAAADDQPPLAPGS